MVDDKALLNGFLVVIGTSTLLSAQYQALHQLLLRYVELQHGCHLVAALAEHLLQGLSLRDGTGETVEDDTLVLLAERIVHRSQD